MKGKKLVVALLVVCVLCASCAAFVACDNKTDGKNDKAIIYVTALFAGGLYDQQTGVAKWEPFETEFDAGKLMAGELGLDELLDIFEQSGEIPAIIQLAIKAISYQEDTLLWELTLDNDGVGYNPNIVPANGLPKDANGKVMDISYGAFGLYKPFVDNISAKYGSEYDVMVYNQDWRQSPQKSAAELESFINAQGYSEVIFMSHSMGAPVVNSYLARSQSNRDNVKLYMGFAPATLGSFDALAALSCVDVYVNNFLVGMDLSGLPFDVNQVVGDFVNGKLGDFFRNNIGLMSLVPSWQLISSDQYDDDNPAITIDGEPISTKEELYDFYKSLRWAKYLKFHEETDDDMYLDEEDIPLYDRVLAQDGEYADKDGYKLKTAAATLDEYYDSLFVNGKIASESVNSYYYLGTGSAATITNMKLTTRRDEDGNPLYDAYGCVQYDYELITGGGAESKMGDGTVPYYSSIGGNTATAEYITALGNRLVEIENQGHANVGLSWDLLGGYVMALFEQYA